MSYAQHHVPGDHGGGYIPNTGSGVPGPVNLHGGSYVPGSPASPASPASTVITSQQWAQQSPPYMQQAQRPQYMPPAPAAYTNTAPQFQAHGIQQEPRRRPVSGAHTSEKATSKVSTALAIEADDVEEYNERSIKKHRPDRMRGRLHRLESYMYFRWFVKPHWVSRSGYVYEDSSLHRYRDSMTRVTTAYRNDRYISPYDAKVKTLVVQCVDDILSAPSNSTWKRTYIRCVSPALYRLAMWPLNHIDMRHSKPETSDDWLWLLAKWIPASLALTICIGFKGDTAQERNRGAFDPLPYRFYGYPKASRNALELDPDLRKNLMRQGLPINPISQRLLRPRYLCFINDPESNEMQGWYLANVEEWITGYKSEKLLKYVVVTYTGEQFRTNQEKDDLLQIAERSARNAGVNAFWVSCTCMPEDDQLQEDVYRIADVIRGASQLVLAVGPPSGQGPGFTADEMLKQWGTRIWTFPEVLLAPSGKPIIVHCRGKDVAPFPLEKSQFAAKVWTDAPTSRQLIDHYEGSLILSRLELVTLALECLHSRKTWQYLPGDHSYALMGLLRLRPTVDPSDSAFQAFARLSLANDSDKLLERLIALMPADVSQPWHTMDDAYGAKLWDIEPLIQVAGIGHDDTVIIDNARAANVRWKSFAPVANIRRSSWKRFFAELMVHTSGFVWYFSITLMAIASKYPASGSSPSSTNSGSPFKLTKRQLGLGTTDPRSGFLASGALLFVYATIIIFASPYLLRIMYGGKLWDTQAWFFAFEGYLNIETIEKQIFGAWLNRLEWTPYASPLSRHAKNRHGECEGIDPTSDPSVRSLVDKAKAARPGDQRIFTLVDTCTMSVTLFSASSPPIGFIMVGCEGGSQRAIGVSLDWPTNTLYRETVLRMETPVLGRMSRIPRVKIGLRRPAEKVKVRPA